MDPEGSITLCVAALKRGDRAVAQRLWEAYFRRLVALARSRLHSTSRRVADTIPGGRLHVVEGGPHFPNRSHRLEVQAVIGEFLASLGI